MSYPEFLVAGFPTSVFGAFYSIAFIPKEGMKILFFLIRIDSFHLSYQLQERGKLRYRDRQVPPVDFTHVDKC